ncbi:MAG: hypothetical protein MJ096_00570 [Clostridia bacterium]|nr:hypothetical protein [Clostridia bacterium]
MKYKHVTLVCGHYGSGKTNIAVNMAFDLKKQYPDTAIADLDIVNPYFRTTDSRRELEEAGIRVIASEYAGTNLDAPALPAEIYAITENADMKTIVDVGGDDRGALALGRIAPAIKESGDFDMLLVINKYRPLTPDAESTVEVMHEIETACRLPFTGIVNNSNLGELTTPETVLESAEYAEAVSRLSGLPIVLTTARDDIAEELGAFPLTLQKKPI